jgi:hypothetical protein
MLGAIPGSTARHDLAAFGNKALQSTDILVIDRQRFIGAEAAYFPPSAAAPPCSTAIAPAALAAAAAITLAITIRPRAARMALAVSLFHSLFVSHLYL